MQKSTLGAMAAWLPASVRAAESIRLQPPFALATWNHGQQANTVAWELLRTGSSALDAVERGVMAVEDNPEVRTVGLGGYPDREGNVTLDACIMNEKQQCGSVAFLQHIRNPIAVARRVMENTPHIMLVGEGALQFALSQGFVKENLLTPETLAEWQALREHPDVKLLFNIENHDTIGMLAMDAQGNLSGACTTSGTAWKMHGRVGDSPIIGAGLYVDNEVGAATATGWGEEVIRNAGSAMVVEMMRQGRSPQEACEEIVRRIARKNANYRDFQVGFLAVDRSGRVGTYCIQPGFTFACVDHSGPRHLPAPSML
ncbi:MAG TPA: N(4)-(beta-N-acetylglucosaminyl)-L-asparaginase [Desulfobacterales bacterium]|nr:N(4)-(beta-N-acetylglucosaminyl)-L-asparaginase [Desulfobacterales bacterium]